VRHVAVVFTLSTLLSACGSQKATPSALQRYQSLSAALDGVTSTTSTAARDMTRLGAQLKSANVVGVRAQAVLLKFDGEELSSRSGSIAVSIRTIALHETDRVLVQYFKTVVDALGYLWAEGQSLKRIADLLWWDPDSIDGNDTAKLAELSSQARLDASMSVRAAGAAQSWRARHRGSFRFVPVALPSPIAAAQ
jgi:hypothetical protein